jgi:hypothetical protein
VMTRASLRMALLALLAGGCASSPPAGPARTVGVAPPLAATTAGALAGGPLDPADPALVSVAAVSAPSKLAIDGDVREWGSLLASLTPSDPPLPPKRTMYQGGEPAAPPPSGPNPRNAASRLAIAITGDALLIAAELGEPAREGIWLGIGSWPPALAPIGEYSRGGGTRDLECEYQQIDIGEGMFKNGPRNPPETIAACKAILERHARFVARHEQRFVRRFKIDREGVRGVSADGALHGFEGARAVFKPGAKGATVEITLPLQAMPRLTQAPLHSLRLVARAATSPKPPEFAVDQWVWVDLPKDLSFEPYGDLRAAAFDSLLGRTVFPPGLSYQPGDALRVESIRYPESERKLLVPHEEALYEKRASLGDVEVGQVTAYTQQVAILKKGKLVALVQGQEDRPLDEAAKVGIRGVVKRDGALHVVSYSPQKLTEGWGWEQPKWSVIAVAADGTHREAVEHDGTHIMWNDVTEFANTELDAFGLRGSTRSNEGELAGKEVGAEVTWSWDRSKKMYTPKERRIPVPKPAKK